MSLLGESCGWCVFDIPEAAPDKSVMQIHKPITLWNNGSGGCIGNGQGSDPVFVSTFSSAPVLQTNGSPCLGSIKTFNVYFDVIIPAEVDLEKEQANHAGPEQQERSRLGRAVSGGGVDRLSRFTSDYSAIGRANVLA